jgi:hypothetical protein
VKGIGQFALFCFVLLAAALLDGIDTVVRERIPHDKNSGMILFR